MRNIKNGTPERAEDKSYEAAIAEVLSEFEADRVAKLRRRAAAILESRGVVSPEETDRRKRTAAMERESLKGLGFSFVDEAPGPWKSLPILTDSLRLKPVYSAHKDGVYIVQRGEALKMASPIIADKKPGTLWAHLNGAWTLLHDIPTGVQASDVSNQLVALQAAGVELGRKAFETGRQPSPAWSYLWGYIADGVAR